MPGPRGLLILGIGNVLMGDEGVGIRALDRLQQDAWPADVTLVDGGTGGFHLLALLQDYEPVVMIDAAADGCQPGTVRVLRPRFASDFPPSLSAHDIGLRDLVETTALLGHLPELHLVTVSIAEVSPMCLSLSPPVLDAIPRVVHTVHAIVQAHQNARGGGRLPAFVTQRGDANPIFREVPPRWR